MKKFKVGDRVRIVAVPNIFIKGLDREAPKATGWDATTLEEIPPEDLRDQLGNVIRTEDNFEDDEGIVKLDSGVEVLIKEHHLTKVD